MTIFQCKKLLTLYFSLLLISFPVSAQQNIFVIPTLHGLHKTNPNYSYDSLKATIRRIDPVIIAVEIRAEDIHADSAYLKKNYPFEMRSMRYWFPSAIMMGFDWLGDDIEHKPIPANYWKEISAIKEHERVLNADSIYNKMLAGCDSIAARRLQLLRSLSLKELLNSDNYNLVSAYYSCLSNAVKGSIHERVVDFYEKRNARMVSNLREIIKTNPGKTIVILTGDDHYSTLKNALATGSIY